VSDVSRDGRDPQSKRTHPGVEVKMQIEPKEKTKKLSPVDSERFTFIKKLSEKIRADDDAREVWKGKQITANNARQGIRRQTNKPWPGYREVPIPLTDKNIRKIKSTYVSVATQMKNPITVSAEMGIEQPLGADGARDSAQRIARALNGLLKKRDFQWRKKITLFVDYFLENGIALFKVIEKFQSRQINRTLDLERLLGKEGLKQMRSANNQELREAISARESFDLDDEDDLEIVDDILKQFRGGKTQIKFSRKLVFSEPTVIPEKAINVIVPNGTTDVQGAVRIVHDTWVTLQHLQEMADAGAYDKTAIDELEAEQTMRDDRLSTLSQARNEGVDSERGENELFNLREAQCWYKGSDKRAKKWVFTWIERPVTKGGRDKETDIKVIQENEYPYEHGKWSWVKHDHELKSVRWYASRGIPEQIRGLQQVTDRMYNNRLIRDEINNNPMIRVDPAIAGSMGGNEIKFKPGQGLIAGQNQVEIFNRANSVDVSSERLEQQAKAYTEEYVGSTDFTIQSAVSPGSARTKGEIQIAQANANRLIGTDVALFLETLSEVSNMMYLLLKEIVTGPTVIGGVVLTPDDFLTKVIVAWSGSIEATDVAFQGQKALGRLEVLFQYAAPSGLMGPEQIYNAIRAWLETDPDVEDTDQFLAKPQAALVSEVEDQQLDIMRMKNGFDVQVMPNENHGLRIEVIEAFMNDPRNGQILQDQQFLARLQSNLNIHMEAEKMLMGGQNNSSRVKKIAKQMAGTNGRA